MNLEYNMGGGPVRRRIYSTCMPKSHHTGESVSEDRLSWLMMLRRMGHVFRIMVMVLIGKVVQADARTAPTTQS